MKMSLDELIQQSEEIIAQAKARGLSYIETGGGDSIFGLASQLESYLHDPHLNQHHVYEIMMELYKISEKMGNPLATERLLEHRHHAW